VGTASLHQDRNRLIMLATCCFCRRFIETKLPELRWLNQRTFFGQAEISDEFKTPSAIHVIYGDCKCGPSVPISLPRTLTLNINIIVLQLI
jgi:hypothetical protein